MAHMKFAIQVVAPALAAGTARRTPGCSAARTAPSPSRIEKAFALGRYQFPCRSSLPGQSFGVAARTPPGATPRQFPAMLQSTLKRTLRISRPFRQKAHAGLRTRGGDERPASEATGNSRCPVRPRRRSAWRQAKLLRGDRAGMAWLRRKPVLPHDFHPTRKIR
jgi:uncharacterized protein (TIGR03435 family)